MYSANTYIALYYCIVAVLWIHNPTVGVSQTIQWEKLNPIPGKGLESMEIDKDGRVFAFTHRYGGADNSIYRSTNNGDSWEKVGPPGYIGIAPNGTIYAVNGNSVAISYDHGDTWSDPTPIVDNGSKFDVTCVTVNAAGHVFVGTAQQRLYRSTNEGKQWQHCTNGITDTLIFTIASSPTTTGLLYAGSWSGVYVSTNNGDSWERSNKGLIDTFATKIVVGGDGIVYGGFSGNSTFGVARSTNNGKTWEQGDILNQNFPVTIYGMVVNSCLAIATTLEDGIIVSSDQGKTWRKTNTGIPTVPEEELWNFTHVIQLLNGKILIGGTRGKLYRSTTSTDVEEIAVRLGNNAICYPTPSTGIIYVQVDDTIECSNRTHSIVYDYIGNQYSIPTTCVSVSQAGLRLLDCSNLPNGRYYYRSEQSMPIVLMIAR